MNIFTSLLAIVATARLLPQDIEDRTVYTILAKPVSRFEYLLGKLAGVLLLLAISVVVMSATFFAVLYLREQSVFSETSRQLAGNPPDQIADALNAIRTSAFNTNFASGNRDSLRESRPSGLAHTLYFHIREQPHFHHRRGGLRLLRWTFGGDGA